MRRIVRSAAAACVAFGLILAPSVAQAQSSIGAFSARSEGFALRMSVDLSGLPLTVKDAIQTNWTDVRNTAISGDPSLASVLPEQFPFVIDQTFARVVADATDTTNTVTSVLGEGFANLGQVSSDAKGQSNSSNTTDPIRLPDAAFEVLSADAGSILASVTEGPVVNGSAEVADVAATLEAVQALLPPELQSAMDEVVNSVNGAIATLNGTVDTLSTTIFDEIDGTPLGSLLGGVVPDAGTLQSLLTVPDLTDPFSGVAASASAVTSTATSKFNGSIAEADAVSTVGSVDLLGGMVSVGAIRLASHSHANAQPGGAVNSSECSIADVRVGGNTGVSVDGTASYVEVSGQPVPVPIPSDQVAAVKAQVDSVLAALGLTVNLCDAETASANSDGTGASQSVSAFTMTFEPRVPFGIDQTLTDALAVLGMAPGDSIVKLIVDPAVSTSAGAVGASAAPTSLPRTGPAAIGTVLTGLIMAAGALGIRRRLVS